MRLCIYANNISYFSERIDLVMYNFRFDDRGENRSDKFSQQRAQRLYVEPDVEGERGT